ncbi:MAG: DUF72 domain-containing protein [Acidimicrobiales bacterium]
MANRAVLEGVRRRLPDYDLYVELRSARWWGAAADRRQTLALLRANDLTHVIVDAPSSSGLPAVLEATTATAVVRFHGRNDDTWKKRDITPAERFDYLYGEEELAEWTGRIDELAGGVERVHALMNNCHGDKGVRNAGDLVGLLTAAGAVPLPGPSDG